LPFKRRRRVELESGVEGWEVKWDLRACIESAGWIGRVTGTSVQYPSKNEAPEGGETGRTAGRHTRVCWLERFESNAEDFYKTVRMALEGRNGGETYLRDWRQSSGAFSRVGGELQAIEIEVISVRHRSNRMRAHQWLSR